MSEFISTGQKIVPAMDVNGLTSEDDLAQIARVSAARTKKRGDAWDRLRDRTTARRLQLMTPRRKMRRGTKRRIDSELQQVLAFSA